MAKCYKVIYDNSDREEEIIKASDMLPGEHFIQFFNEAAETIAAVPSEKVLSVKEVTKPNR